MTTTTTTDKTVILTEDALTTITAMHHKVQQIGAHFGETSPEYVKAAVSLAQVLTTIYTMGFNMEARVYKDGDLSLYVREGGFGYGIIWFRDRNYDAQLSVPQPGAWSVHS